MVVIQTRGFDTWWTLCKGIIGFQGSVVDTVEPRRLRTKVRQEMQEGLRGYVGNLKHIAVGIIF